MQRFHKAQWGNHPRVRSAASSWRQPLTWQRKAAAAGVRRRVFCSELSDVFDNQAPPQGREDLWTLIAQCPDLDWMLLTKRPQNIRKMLPEGWPWPQVWLGTTAEDQEQWHRRVNLLRAIPAAVRFTSVEPMLEPMTPDHSGVDWVICGGESGKGARYMEPDWARDLLRQCKAASVAFFIKQMTSRRPIPADLLVREFPLHRRTELSRSNMRRPLR